MVVATHQKFRFKIIAQNGYRIKAAADVLQNTTYQVHVCMTLPPLRYVHLTSPVLNYSASVQLDVYMLNIMQHSHC